MSNDIPAGITFQSLANSGMPPAQKSAVMKWYDRTLAAGGNTEQSKLALAKLHVKAAGEGLRSGGESLLVGGILGAVHAQLPGGLDFKKIPIDAVAGVLGIAAGAVGAQMEVGKDLQNAGSAALAVFAFRKTNDLIVEAKLRAVGFKVPVGGSPGAVRPDNIGFAIGKGDLEKAANAGARAPATGAGFAGESTFGWAPGSVPQRGFGFPGHATHHGDGNFGEDPIATAARGL